MKVERSESPIYVNELSLNEQLSREIRESFMPRFGDPEGLATLKSPIVHPHTEDHVEGHVRLEDRLVARPQARGMLPPVWRIVQSHGIANSGLLNEAHFGDDPPPDELDFFTGHPGLHGIKRRVEPLHNDLRGIFQPLRWILSQVGRPGHGTVIPMTAGGQLQVDRLFAFVPFVRPGQMGR